VALPGWNHISRLAVGQQAKESTEIGVRQEIDGTGETATAACPAGSPGRIAERLEASPVAGSVIRYRRLKA